MKIMNIINEICVLMHKIIDAKWYQFIKKYKLCKKVINLENQLINRGIFSLSDGIITFFLSCPKDIRESCNATIKESYIGFCIGEVIIDYNPNQRSFTVSYPENDTEIITYTIYEYSTISNKFKEKWQDLIKQIRDFYIELIENAAIDLARINESSD